MNMFRDGGIELSKREQVAWGLCSAPIAAIAAKKASGTLINSFCHPTVKNVGTVKETAYYSCTPPIKTAEIAAGIGATATVIIGALALMNLAKRGLRH
jgi:hypothetical protein